MSIFKQGSIRGIWDKEWNADTVFRIGYYLSNFFSFQNVVVGFDGRLSSLSIKEALVKGFMYNGAMVDIIGCIDTPAISFANITGKYDGSIMITASHNPPEYNGLKISSSNAQVMSRENGLSVLEKLIEENPDPYVLGGSCRELDISDSYLNFFSSYIKECGHVKAVIDCSNGAAASLVHRFTDKLPGDFIILNDHVDGRFPAHGPDPTDEKNLKQLKASVVENQYDFGICFDGDGDRMIVVDENGCWVSPDLILGILARYYFVHFTSRKNENDNTVLYDARSSNSVKDYVEMLGGTARICSTGHTAMQEGLPYFHGVIGGELPGHYYYRDYFSLDSGWLPFLQLQAILSREPESLSSLVSCVNKYSFSGEINFKVPDEFQDNLRLVKTFTDKYFDAEKIMLDGIRLNYPDWWFLVRMANTESVLRLVVEAKSDLLLSKKIGEVKSFIYSIGGTDY